MSNSKDTKPPVFTSKAIISKYNLDIKLATYFREILDFNKKVNIVSRETSFKDLLDIAADSLIPFEFLPPPTGKIFDIGAGAGFPSIVVLLAFPDLQGLLIERTQKKTIFLHRMINLFELNAEIQESNFIDIGAKIASLSFDIGLMKLVRPDKKILRTAFNLLKPSGKLIYYSNFDETLVELPANIEVNKFSYFLDKNNRFKTITVF